MNSESAIGSIAPVAPIDRSEINRANAQHSTGPRTPEGTVRSGGTAANQRYERSRSNALKHNLYAQVLIPAGARLDDDPDAFASLHASLRKRYAPEDELEERMVERLALQWCRLDRLCIHAQQRLADDLTPRVNPDLVALGFDPIPEAKEPVDALLRCESVSAAEARLERSISRLLKDLAFLARYRQRAQETGVERQAKAKAKGERADPPLHERTQKPESEARNEPSAPQEGNPSCGSRPAPATPGTGSAGPINEAWLSPYEIERRRRLGWKPAPDPQPKTGDQPAA
jgi:hypothetical protein